MYDDPYQEEYELYEVEVVKILTYIVKVGATSKKEAADKARLEVEALGISSCHDEEIEVTDINKYELEPDLEDE